jgi:hypothetical protein
MDTLAPPPPALVPAEPPDAAIARIAARYHAAQGGVLSMVMSLGSRVEAQMHRLPPRVQDRIETSIRGALERAYGLASSAPDRRIGAPGQTAMVAVSGALGGLGGMPTAIAELPVTVTLLLRSIQEVAREHGFDPEDEAVRRESLRVFGSGGPLAADDGVDTAFIGARLTLTGPALHRMMAAVAPRLAAALGQKLAAQAVPVLGAVAGAGLNATYLHYYREMAHVRFGLLALAQRHDPVAVLAAFGRATAPRPVTRA